MKAERTTESLMRSFQDTDSSIPTTRILPTIFKIISTIPANQYLPSIILLPVQWDRLSAIEQALILVTLTACKTQWPRLTDLITRAPRAPRSTTAAFSPEIFQAVTSVRHLTD